VSRNDPPTLTDPYANEGPSSSGPPSDAPPPAAPDAPRLEGLRKERPTYEITATPAPPAAVSPFVALPLPAPPKPKKTRARRKVPWRTLGIVAGSIAASGLAAGGVALYLYTRSAPIAPCSLTDLPKSTAYVERLPTKWVFLDVGDLSEAPPEAAWSHYAEHFCGGTDLFQNLLRAQGERQRTVAAYALRERRDTGDALDCGKHLAEAHDGSRSYYVRIMVPKSSTDDDDVAASGGDSEADKRPIPAWFAVDRFDVDELPPTMRRFRSVHDHGELSDTRCLLLPGSGREDDCVGRSPATARLDRTDLFFSGTLDHLGYLAQKARQGPRFDQDVLTEIGDRVAGFDAAVIGTHEGFPPSWVRRMGIAAPSSDSGGTSFDQPLLAAIDDADAHFGIGDSFTAARGGRFHLELVPRRAKDAETLADALQTWRTAFLDDRDARDPDFEPLLGYAPRSTEKEYRAMVHAASLAALRDADFKVEDGLVRFDVEVRYDESGDRLADEYLKELGVRAKLAAEVVRALYEGDKPDRDALLELGGSELMSQIERPSLTTED